MWSTSMTRKVPTKSTQHDLLSFLLSVARRPSCPGPCLKHHALVILHLSSSKAGDGEADFEMDDLDPEPWEEEAVGQQ